MAKARVSRIAAGRRLLVAIVSGVSVLASVSVVGSPARAVTVGPVMRSSTALPNQFFADQVVDRATAQVFLSQTGSDDIAVFDYYGHLTDTIKNVFGPYGMLVDGQNLWVTSNTTSMLYDINTVSHRVMHYFYDPRGYVEYPEMILKAHGALWITMACGANWDYPHVVKFDLTTHEWLYYSAFEAGYCPDIIKVNENTLVMYDEQVSPDQFWTVNIGVTPPELTKWVYYYNGANAQQATMEPDGKHFVLASGAPYELVEFDAATLAPTGLVYTTGPYPSAVAVASTGQIAAGTNGYANPDLYLFNAGDAQPTWSYNLTNNTASQVWPYGLDFSPRNKLLFVANGYFGSNSSGPTVNVYFNVAQLQPAATSATSVSATPATQQYGATKLSAAISGSYPAGLVRFYAGQQMLGWAIVRSGTATLNVNLPAGNYQIHAHYSGDDANLPSTSPAQSLTVQPASTATSLTITPVSGTVGNDIQLTANVASKVNASTVPTGTVTFYDGTINIATVTLSAGQASTSYKPLVFGTHTYTAQYSGANSFQPSSATAQGTTGVG